MIREQELNEELAFLEESLQKVSEELAKLKKNAPEGFTLRAAKCGNVFQYFLRQKGSGGNGEYLKKGNREIAATLAQIEYDEKLSSLLHRFLDVINSNKPNRGAALFDEALRRMPPAKRALVKPLYLPDQDYIREWSKQSYDQLPFKDDSSEFYTRQGLRVRSKSEVIIADILDEMCVPFLYEKPLRLQSRTLHPDFTLLNLRNRSELYWEHFGMMDDMDYLNNAFLKIRTYESNGLYQHSSVIWTFETSIYPLNTREIRKMVKELRKNLGYDELSEGPKTCKN